jgi:cytochrome c5
VWLLQQKKTEFQYASGKEVYEAVCQSCHNAGVINAPILGDKASWGERANKKISLLYQNAINGLNAMPAKGGRPDLSDKEIEIAVDYMMDSIK